MKNVTDFRKTVETGVDPRQVPFNKAAPGLFKVPYAKSRNRRFEIVEIVAKSREIVDSSRLS